MGFVSQPVQVGEGWKGDGAKDPAEGVLGLLTREQLLGSDHLSEWVE